MPPFVVLVVCLASPLPMTPHEKANAAYTGYAPFTWNIIDGKMQCKTVEIALYNQSDARAELTPHACNRAGLVEGVHWDQSHPRYKYWRSACPTRIIDTETGETIGWQKPSCTAGAWRGKITCSEPSEV